MSADERTDANVGGASLAKLESLIDNSADLRGPLSTIPDGLQSRLGSSGQAGASDPASLTRKAEAFTPVKWSQYFDDAQDVRVESRRSTFRVYFAGESGPILFCLHGGGYTGLTWALVAARLKSSCRVVAVDMRGHGETETPNDSDLAADTLTQDAVALWEEIFAADAPPTVLVGHSVGGAIAVRTAATQKIKSLQGLVVIDVVEGTALGALPSMQRILHNRPTSFPSLAAAIAWGLHSGMARSREAAAVSLPSQLTKQRAVNRERWVWRTDLAHSSSFWRGWFSGLSELFLAAKAPKLLLLAGTDRLDKTLTIGQMQGRFQMVLLPQAGHAVHEDEAEKTSEVLKTFVERFRIGQELPIFRKQ